MGVDGLYKFINKHFPEVYNNVPITKISGKPCIIDGMQHIYGQLIYMRSKDKEIINSDGKNISHIHGLINSLTYYLKHGIIPIFVFDGKTPEIKKKKTEERSRNTNLNLTKLKELEDRKKDISNNINLIKMDTSEYTERISDFEYSDIELEKDDDIIFGTPPILDINGMIEEGMNQLNSINDEYKKIYKKTIVMKKYYINDWIEILELLGLPVIKASGEADPVCAYLLKNNPNIYGIISDDSDMLVFGASRLMRKSHNQHFTIIELKKLIDKIEMLVSLEFGKYTRFTTDDLINFSILLGTDYGKFNLNCHYTDALDLLKFYIWNDKNYKKIIFPEDYEYFEIIKKYYTEQNFDEEYAEYLSFPEWKKPKLMELKKRLLELDVDEEYIDKNKKFLDSCYNRMQRSKKSVVQKHNNYQFNAFSNIYSNPISNISINLFTGTSLDSHSTLFENKNSERSYHENNLMLETNQIRRERSNSLDSKKHIGDDEPNYEYKFNCVKGLKQSKSKLKPKSTNKFKGMTKYLNHDSENSPIIDNKIISDDSDDDFEHASILLIQKNDEIFYFEP